MALSCKNDPRGGRAKPVPSFSLAQSRLERFGLEVLNIAHLAGSTFLGYMPLYIPASFVAIADFLLVPTYLAC